MKCPSIARTTGFPLSAREKSLRLRCCCLWLLLLWSLSICSPASRACADSFGGTHSVVASDDDWNQALSPSRIPVSFPGSFTDLPALRVWLDSEQSEYRPRITHVTTNGFEVEISAIPVPLPARPASVEEGFADETVVGFIAGMPALVELKPDGELFVHHASGLSPEEEWKTERVNLLPLFSGEGVPRAATLANDCLVLLWTGPTGLCVSRAAGPFGEPPWTTEVIPATDPGFTAANIAEVGGRLAVSLVHPTQGQVQVSLWGEEADGVNPWTQRFQHPVTLPQQEQWTQIVAADGGPVSPRFHFLLATRVGQLNGHILVSVGNVSENFQFLGCLQDACFYGNRSTGGTVWLIADSHQSLPRVESAPTSPWTQVLNRDGRTFIVTRRVRSYSSSISQLAGPELQAFPRAFHWEAADGPRIRINGEQLLGFGVPTLPDGPTRSYRVLRTSTLSPTAWEWAGQVVPGRDGSFGLNVGPRLGDSAFFRVEAQP